MKKRSPFLALLLSAAAFSFCLASCKTTRFIIPGEKKVAVDNIFVEYYNIAEEYSKIPNYQKAAEYYLKAAGNKEISNAAYFKAARSYALAKNWQKALEIYTEILKHDKDNESVKESLAYIYAMNNEFEKSERLYLESISSNPNIARVLVNYTIVLVTLEKYKEAAEQLEVIKEKFPDEEKIASLEEKITAALNPPKDESEGKIPTELLQPELTE
ncbi:MAG: tetratricopeptide repeat protein [Treponema sp.]|nr:tetratricopeptide repeat protein [Treponema sp.]